MISRDRLPLCICWPIAVKAQTGALCADNCHSACSCAVLSGAFPRADRDFIIFRYSAVAGGYLGAPSGSQTAQG